MGETGSAQGKKATGIAILNARLLLCSPVWLFGIFLIVFFTCLILLYQENSTPLEGSARKASLEWAVQEPNPSEALYERQLSLYGGRSETELFSGDPYGDFLLLTNVRQYVKSCANYSEQLSQLIQNAQMGMNFSYSTYEMVVRYRLTIRQYEKLNGVQAVFGNYLAWEKFFSMGIAEFAFVLMLLYTVYHIIVIERERGMNPLVHATAHGGAGYFFQKLAAAISVMTFLFILLYGMKLLMYLSLYGSDAMSRPMQSLSGYLTCPYKISIAQYLVVYLAYQYLFWFFILLSLLVVSSFSLSEAGISVFLLAAAGASWVMTEKIHEYSAWIWLRNLNPIMLGNIAYWVQSLHVIVIGRIFGEDFYLWRLQFPLLVMGGYCLLLMAAGAALYQRGLRASTKSRGFLKRLWNYRQTVGTNELQFLLLQKKHLLIFLALSAIAVYFMEFKPLENANLRYEKSILTTLNSLSFDDACDWIEEKQKEFEQLHLSDDQLLLDYMNGKIDESGYEQARASINQQLILEPLVEQFSEQAEEMKILIEEDGIQNIRFAYQSAADQIYGSEGRQNRVFLAMLIAAYIVLAVLNVMPMDKSCGVNRLIGTTPLGMSAIHKRILRMSVMTALLAALVYSIWLLSLYLQYDWIGFDAAAQSWPRYRSYRGSCTVLQTIIINFLYQSVKWGIFAYVLSALTLFSKNAIWTEMLGIMGLLGPLAMDLLEISWIRKLPYLMLMVYGDGDFLLNKSSLLIVVAVAMAGYGLMRRGREQWVQ